MTALVTGSNGFLGSAVVRRLAAARPGQTIRCLVRPGSSVARLSGVPGVEIVRGSLNSPDDCKRAVSGVDTVYHLAAAMGGPPSEMFLSTVVATRNLLDAVAGAQSAPGANEIRLVHCSSFAVYGPAELPRGAVVDESTPLEAHPEKRDSYAHTKLRQEELVRQVAARERIPLVILRPGVVYGPGGPAMSSRVGLNLFGLFLHLGGKNALPLTYVDNCADAFVAAGTSEQAVGHVFNVVDDDLVDARTFLKQYRAEVKPVRYVSVPYAATQLLSRAVEAYAERSRGQLPAIFTPYKTASTWKGTRFDNSRLKQLGWRPQISTEEGLRRHFAHLAQVAAGAAGAAAAGK